ncbi:MAG: FAD-dependent oxidoreductase [Proteobacteria bacterium]|nr:FAD-dependent oxidoreductase [Pseudomonadota bacterium]
MKVLGPQPQINQDRCLAWNVERSPCEQACPAHVDVEGYIAAVRKRDFPLAAAIIREHLPLPATLGRVCHHPCENACKLGRLGEPVAIAELKRFIMDYVMIDGVDPVPVRQTQRERVAVIGSGPAGLAAAYDLVRKGYGITVYEASPVPGGMLAAGIPEYILPARIVEAEIDYIRKLGVDIQTDTRIGEGLSFHDLSGEGFNAFLLATGLGHSARLDIPGADLESIQYALPLLRRVNMGDKAAFQGKVVVIGGGGVAMDAARTIMRLGADEVHVACPESTTRMPALPWEVKAAEEEGVVVHTSLAPQKFVSRQGSRGAVVEFKRVVSTHVDDKGRISWTLASGDGSECTMEADSVVVAIGQTPDPSVMNSGPFNLTKQGTFQVDPVTLLTNVPGMFAAGDAVTGPNSVIDAVASGKRAAVSIDRYLKGEPFVEDRTARPPVVNQDVLPRGMRISPRRGGLVLPKHLRNREFREVNLGFSEEQAVAEAGRCLRCKTCNRCMEEYGCVAIGWSQNQTIGKITPRIDRDLCIGCMVCPQLCPYGSIEAV